MAVPSCSLWFLARIRASLCAWLFSTALCNGVRPRSAHASDNEIGVARVYSDDCEHFTAADAADAIEEGNSVVIIMQSLQCRYIIINDIKQSA
eukprot:6200025-Pleurochrysis_carterae.AAC.1